MIHYVKGDLLYFFDIGLIDTVAHGCNMQGRMASGIAGQIAKKYPQVKDRYLSWHGLMTDQPFVLGEMQEVMVAGERSIFNCLTQKYYGNDGKVYASLDAIKEVAQDLSLIMKDLYDGKENKLGIPKIGCGLGGLDWETQVKPIFEEAFKDLDLYVFSL